MDISNSNLNDGLNTTCEHCNRAETVIRAAFQAALAAQPPGTGPEHVIAIMASVALDEALIYGLPPKQLGVALAGLFRHAVGKHLSLERLAKLEVGLPS